MANLSQYSQIFLLNYINSGSTASRPTAWAVGLSTTAPGSTGAGLLGEIGGAQGYVRLSASWCVATGTPPIATNLNAMTFGPFSSNLNVSGIGVLDSIAATGTGNLLWMGTLAAPRNITAGDSMVIAAVALTTQIN